MFSVPVETAAEQPADTDFGNSKLRFRMLGQHDRLPGFFQSRPNRVDFATGDVEFRLHRRRVTTQRSNRLFLIPNARFQQLGRPASSTVTAGNRDADDE